jgi:hypothetical protein
MNQVWTVKALGFLLEDYLLVCLKVTSSAYFLSMVNV